MSGEAAALSIRERLSAIREEDFAAFTARLVPTVPRESILGIRTPALRALARELQDSREAAAFLDELPHAYFEENCLHAFLLEQIRDFETCLARVERFLPWVNNWAVCDQMSPKVFRKHRAELLERVRLWLRSSETYRIRFGVRMLMNHFLEDDFCPEILELVSVIESTEYYVNMMRAWFFATALAKQWEGTLPLLERRRLDPWTHGKTIQKALESDRVPADRKELLRGLRLTEKA